MSQHYKPGRSPASQPTLFQTPPSDVHPKERERIAQLIALNKSGQALDFAKDVHKRCRSTASETLLVDAYGARFASLVERKLDREATELMELVRERYPSSRERLRDWSAGLSARRGDLSAMLEPLNQASLSAEKQAEIAARVRRDVLDLRALAECETLPAEHPLRTAATVLYRAFEAVTAGPVADEGLTLPEVSRSSPLAPWKMLVRAIAAYYRQDDVLCEKYVAAIDPDSAAARLAPALRALMRKAQSLTPAATALVNQAGGNLDSLRIILKRLDSALDRSNQPIIVQEIRNAVAACRQSDPGLLERLKQHISVRAMLAGMKADKVAAAMDGPSLKNANFWRLIARAFEQETSEPLAIGFACSAWEEFRKHAVHEGWFPAKGPEAATLYLHIADLLHRIDDEELHSIRAGFVRHFDGHTDYYRGQPAEIRALMPNRGSMDVYFLKPDEVLERACEADPIAENFQRWFRHTKESSPGACDDVAQRWCAALPKDVAPLLYLMQSAEKRNALQKAFRFMEQAERVDALNPEVRGARLRLLVSMAARHLREEKPKLAEKDLLLIKGLPQAQQGDRPAFLAAMRFVYCLSRESKQQADSAHANAVRFLGDGVTAYLLILEVERWCGRQRSVLGDPPPPTVPFCAAFGRVCAMGEDMGMPVTLIPKAAEQLLKELSIPDISVSPRVLAALGEVAIRDGYIPLAYMIARAGLAQGAGNQAGFLFLRARAMPPWEEDRRDSCLAAASDLARRQHDSGLLKRIAEWREEILDWLDIPEQAQAAMNTEEINRVVEREIQERKLPTAPPDLPDDEDCQCPACCAQRGQLPPELQEMVEKLGPEAVMEALAQVLGAGGKPKRGRKRSRLPDLDAPF